MTQGEFQGLTRFVPTAGARQREFLQAAEEYTFRLTDEHRAGLLIKPLDAANHHVDYFRTTYSALNTIAKLRLPSGSTVVDAGAGPGWLSEMLLLLGYRVVLLEPSQDMLDVARVRIQRAQDKWGIDLLARAEFVPAGIETMPAHLGTEIKAEAVLFHEAWHHVIQEDVAARNVFDLLREGGQIAVLVEGRWFPGDRAVESALEKEMLAYGTLESPFNRDYMRHVLEKAGFADVAFYHAVNGLFRAEQGSVTIDEAAGDMHEKGWNNCIARRPYAPSHRALDANLTRGELALQSVRPCAGGKVRLSLLAENTGREIWRAKGARGEGLVVLGMVGVDSQGAEKEMDGRGYMLHDAGPGASVEVSGEFELRPGFERFAVSLLAEGSFWFEDRLTLADRFNALTPAA